MKMNVAKQMPISFFKRNINNCEFFDETDIDLTALEEDIKKRGIFIPLMAKEDGTLLGGHCRFEVAKRLKIKTLPVVIIEGMTEREELEYLLKDNTIRRHIGKDERLKIYRKIVPDFDNILIKGFPRNSMVKENISALSGLNINTIKTDFQLIRETKIDIRKRRPKEKSAVITFRRAATNIINLILSKSIEVEEIEKIIAMMQEKIDNTKLITSDNKKSRSHLLVRGSNNE